ncbi:HupE/UreJ family protein [Massilia varians]|uniref:HupE/UreJ family protein n=1 Tax=Massilia varians TaxID=457921 RepID=UPI002553E195|nr:HupE/UreJ family protein [Massilia varians]MDK6078258.1 HupE/UreJ family protein [Massilia varians]
MQTLCLAGLALAWTLFAVPARAHDPFDGSTQVTVLDERIEARVTLGYDAARAMLRALGLPPEQAGPIARGGETRALAPGGGARLLRLHEGGRELAPQALLAAGGREEVSFVLTYPRPASNRLALRASYFELLEDMRPGTLVVTDARRRLLASTLLSASSPEAALPLEAATAGAALNGGVKAFFLLGVEHILTGFDHLLFLCALLVTLTSARQMIAIVTAFTLAHSLTLALAALDVVALPASLVEPLIALSIIVACVANLLRREAARARLWMAGAFGLVHGFGFAGMLRESVQGHAGRELLVPLLSFNLGVEAGQLLVAAAMVGLLVLARRRPAFIRYGAPAISCLVIAVSTWWLLERLYLV